MRHTVAVLALVFGVWAWAQQPTAGPKPTPELVAFRQQIEANFQRFVAQEMRQAKVESGLKLYGLEQGRIQSQQEIESLRREIQALQQAVQTLQSRVRD